MSTQNKRSNRKSGMERFSHHLESMTEPTPEKVILLAIYELYIEESILTNPSSNLNPKERDRVELDCVELRGTIVGAMYGYKRTYNELLKSSITDEQQLVLCKYELSRIPDYFAHSMKLTEEQAALLELVRDEWMRYMKQKSKELELLIIPFNKLARENDPSTSMPTGKEVSDRLTLTQLTITFKYLLHKLEAKPASNADVARALSSISGLSAENIRQALSNPLQKLRQENEDADILKVISTLKQLGLPDVSRSEITDTMPKATA